ncbi:MAG: serine/threonine-protein phosphatase [Bryobacterales bacterium]|nr:serine/threonine-protein phosphatase [Bryobacterales bacterium]
MRNTRQLQFYPLHGFSNRELQRESGLGTHVLPFRNAWIGSLEYFGDSEPDDIEDRDFFEFFSLPPSELKAIIGSVYAAGPERAAWKQKLQLGIQGFAAISPASLASELNRMVWESSLNEIYATIFLASVDSRSRQLTYVNAGHEAALLIRAETGRILRLERTGAVLGLSHRSTFGQRSIPISRGDTLIAFSDGICEALSWNGGQLSERRLLEIIRPRSAMAPRQIVRAILDETAECNGSAPERDRTVIAARIAGSPPAMPQARSELALAMSV